MEQPIEVVTLLGDEFPGQVPRTRSRPLFLFLELGIPYHPLTTPKGRPFYSLGYSWV